MFVLQEEESQDVHFAYEDSDDLPTELAEFYSYTENPEFAGHQKAFSDFAERYSFPTSWK